MFQRMSFHHLHFPIPMSSFAFPLVCLSICTHMCAYIHIYVAPLFASPLVVYETLHTYVYVPPIHTYICVLQCGLHYCSQEVFIHFTPLSLIPSSMVNASLNHRHCPSPSHPTAHSSGRFPTESRFPCSCSRWISFGFHKPRFYFYQSISC